MFSQLFKNHFKLINKFKFSTSASLNNSIKKKVCIVGAGPAGFYAAQYVLKHTTNCDVDIIEKLPVPFGLVRFGVAPDHPEVKNVINTFTKTAENPNIKYFGNVSLGKDISLQELRNRYHAVLLTYGADEDRHLNIPNENLPNVLSARKFVAWYNGLPGAENLNPDLGGKTVALIGQGNVAVDVARILLSPIDSLKKTDITEYALEKLSSSKIEKVILIGRRGPLQAAFTIKELREMLKLPNVDTIWRNSDFDGIEGIISQLERPRKRLTELMVKSLKSNIITEGAKQFVPIFLRSPKTINGNLIDLTVNKLEDSSARPTDHYESIEADLILRSIGYKSICVDKDIHFDQKNGLVLNNFGRVLKKNSDPKDSIVENGLYVAGWLATGPTGVILTTMNGAFGVAKTLCDDLNSNSVDCTSMKPGLELKEHPTTVSWRGWQKIDAEEIRAGKLLGKPREKIVDVSKMLQVAGL